MPKYRKTAMKSMEEFKDEVLVLVNPSVEFIEDPVSPAAVSKSDIGAAEVRIREKLAEEMSMAFFNLSKVKNLTCAEIAKRLGVSAGLISRRFKGEENLTLRTIAAMFLALEREVIISSRPLAARAETRTSAESRPCVIISEALRPQRSSNEHVALDLSYAQYLEWKDGIPRVQRAGTKGGILFKIDSAPSSDFNLSAVQP